MSKKILLVGGGTGGHALPLLNLYKYFKKQPNNQTQFHWIGESDSIESRLSSDNNIPFSPIICGKLRRYFSLQTLFVPFQVFIGTLQSVAILMREEPDAVFSKGGYVSLPVAISARILKIPVYLHESDSIPGLANRFVARFATGIFCAFSEADKFFPEGKIKGHGVLLSPDIAALQSVTNLPRLPGTQILISCGSQGSASIFDAVLDVLPYMTDAYFRVILGVKNLHYRIKFEKFSNVEVFDFFYDQTEYLKIVQKSDLVVARSGSGIFEFEAFGVKMILIPHPHTGNNHQYWNAVAFQKKGHELVEQKNIDQLPRILEKYRNFKKSSEKSVVDMSLFDTIGKIISE